MKTFEELLDRLNEGHTQKIEKKFEKELMNQILYYYEDYALDLDDASYIAVFTSEAQASLLEVEEGQLYAGYVDAIPNPNGYEYVLNPMSHAIIFDQNIWSEGNFEVLGQNTSELLFMMQSKEVLEAYDIELAYLINIKDGYQSYASLVVNAMPQDASLEQEFVTKIQALMENTSVRDLYSLTDKQVQGLVKGLKPYYKK